MKQCIKCNEVKSLADFYKDKACKSGRKNTCSVCTRKAKALWAKNNSEKVRKTTDVWKETNREAVAEYNKVYFKEYRKHNREKIQQNIKRYRDKHPIKYLAHNKVSVAISQGVLIRPEECSLCGNTEPIEAHHCDYSKPLDIMWLCGVCHKHWHSNHKSING